LTQNAEHRRPGSRERTARRSPTMAAATPVLPPALWTAASQGRIQEARRLLEEGACIEARWGRMACTALDEAAYHGHKDVVVLLLEHGADLSGRDNDGRTPLHYAAKTGRTEVTSLLIAHGAEVSAASNYGSTPLQYASQNGHTAVVLLLLEKGADLSSKDCDGWSVLHQTACYGHRALTSLLLDKGADEQSKTNGGTTPAEMATASSNPEVAAMLQAEGLRRAQCVAFAMGQQERLGAGSRVQELEVGVVRMVLDQV